jgi:hypothetical protein
VKRAVFGSGTVRPAIKAPIGHPLGKNEIYDGFELLLIGFEIGSIIQKHAIEADVADLDGANRTNTSIFPFFPGED